MVTAGSSNCISCFDEWTTMGSGSTFCFPMKDCLPGTYRTTNDGSCILCNSGSFSVVNNSVSCTLCSPGKYSHDKGSSLCTPRCGPGFYSSNTGESTFFSHTCQTCLGPATLIPPLAVPPQPIAPVRLDSLDPRTAHVLPAPWAPTRPTLV